jgi:hypothetical protein
MNALGLHNGIIDYARKDSRRDTIVGTVNISSSNEGGHEESISIVSFDSKRDRGKHALIHTARFLGQALSRLAT